MGLQRVITGAGEEALPPSTSPSLLQNKQSLQKQPFLYGLNIN